MGNNKNKNNFNQIQKELNLAEAYKLKIDDNLVVLSEDNVARVEAMIRTDSAYLKSYDDTIHSSSAYWFKQLKSEIEKTDESKKLKETSCETIKKLVKAIDRENSTRINTDKVGLKEIPARISEFTIKDFLNNLKNPDNTLELFNKIAEKTSDSTGKNHRKNPSFASKFCHYACFHLFKNLPEQDNYPIYDNVLKKILPEYAKKYNVEYENADLKDYSRYRKLIEKIIKNSQSNISKNGFDHLLWYYHKARM